MFSRRIEDLTPECRVKYFKFVQGMYDAEIPFMLTCTKRKQVEQFVLYAQGRMPLDEVNKLRKDLGWAPLTKWQNVIVTWTLNSYHLPVTQEMIDAGKAHDIELGKSRAFDIVILKDGRVPSWESKIDLNDNEIPDYLEAAEIGRSVGLTPGAFWQEPDLFHFQV